MVSKLAEDGAPMTYSHAMTASGARRAAVRVGAFLQLAAFTAVAATFVASLSRTLWRESRPGCVRDGYVYCVPHTVDVAARWPAVVIGVLLALAVVATSGPLHRVAQLLGLLMVGAGTAVFTADQARFAAPVPAMCRSGAGGDCAYVSWHIGHLVVGGGVGLALGLLTLGLEAASRAPERVGGARRATGNALVVLSVPVLLIGLLTLVSSYEDSAAWWWLTAAGAVFAIGQALRLTRLSRPVAWGR
jgi:hypothetical protein